MKMNDLNHRLFNSSFNKCLIIIKVFIVVAMAFINTYSCFNIIISMAVFVIINVEYIIIIEDNANTCSWD